MNLGTTISRLRKARGLKQLELAVACNITQAYLSQIENDRKEPNLTTLKVIGGALEIPLPILFFLAIEKGDIPDDKEDLFSMVSPSLKGLIGDVFLAVNREND